jgi:hypothetical protein
LPRRPWFVAPSIASDYDCIADVRSMALRRSSVFYGAQLALVDRAPFVDQKLVSILQEGREYTAVVELVHNRMMSAPHGLGSYSAFVLDGMPAAAGHSVTVSGVHGQSNPILAAVCNDEQQSGPHPRAN